MTSRRDRLHTTGGAHPSSTPDAALAPAVASDPSPDAEASLRRLEERIQAIALPTGQIIWSTNADGLVDTDLPAWQAYTGQSAEEVRGWGWLNAVHPDDREPISGAWTAAQRTRSYYEGEYRIRRRDGVYRSFMARGVPILDASGNIREWAGVSTDITGLKQMEEERRKVAEAAAREAARARDLEAIFETVTDGLLVYDREGNVVRVNPAAREFLAIEAQPDYLSQPLDKRGSRLELRGADGRRLPQEEWPASRVLRGEVLRGATTVDITVRALDGTMRTFNFAGAPVPAADGGIAGGAVIMRDVTERRRLEGQAQEAAAREAARARELEALFETIKDGVCMYAPDGRIVHMNAAARALMGLLRSGQEYTQNELSQLLRLCDELNQPLPPERWPSARVLRGELLTGADTAEVTLTTPDGHEVEISASGAPIRDTEGQIVGAVLVNRDVTERRRLEREVAARASEFEAIFDSIAEAVILYDLDARILRFNAVARDLFALDLLPKFVSLPRRERLTILALRDEQGNPLEPDEWPMMRVLRGEVLRGATAVDVQLHALDGREIQLSMSGMPVRDAEGQIVGAVGVYRDVTERRRLEQALAAHASRLDAIFGAMADAVFVFDTDARIVQANTAARELFALDRMPDYLSMPVADRTLPLEIRDEQGNPVPPSEMPVVRVLRGEVFTGATAVDLQLRALDGRELFISMSGTPIRDAAGQIVGAVAIMRDVTERRRLDRRTHDALAALLEMADALVAEVSPAEEPPDLEAAVLARGGVARRLSELTRSVLACERVGIISVDPETELLHPIADVGLPPDLERLWWSSWDEETHLHERYGRARAERLRAGEVQLLDRTQPLYRARPVVGGRIALLVPMRIGSQLVGILRLDHDDEREYSQDEIALAAAVARLAALVIQRDRLQREREEAHASELALREANRRMDEFLSIASHELRTPLTGIKVGIQFAQRRLRDLARRKAAEVAREDQLPALLALLDQAKAPLESSDQQLDLLNRLVDDLLDASRIQVGRLTLRPEPCDAIEIVCEAVEHQRMAAERAILLDLPAEVTAPIVADADRIGQVMTNFLTNALKYSAADRPVHVSLCTEERYVRVAVRDEGPGLPLEEQQLVWQRFHRAPGVEVQSGSGVGLGLGLYISKTIIERHHGQVGVESAPGAGCTFWFALPLATAEPSSSPDSSAEAAPND